MEKKKRKELPSKEQKEKRSIVPWIIFIILLAGLALGGWHVLRILTKPESLFTDAAATSVPDPTLIAPAFPIATAAPAQETSTAVPSDAPAATPAPTEPSNPEASPSGRLNIMLMGIDAFESGRTTSGTMPHTDVMMVIAINFDEDKVDLITLPRDTMTTAPGYYGYYKLNGVFNVGLNGQRFKSDGQGKDLEDGFLLTCRAGEEWLGGISIPYYYAVDFQAVIDIVDAIGGIDYDLDIPISTGYAFGKRSYQPGWQHLDGNAVMGYLRVRNGVTNGLDSERTARQRRMLIAIFNKLKTEGKISQIPALITAANSGIYTNTTLSQTTALASYAMKLDGDQIQTRAMYGEIGQTEYDWRYAYVDQQNRIDLIREVFGIEANPVGTCTRQYERWLHTVGFSAMKYMRQAEKVLTRVQEMKDAGEAFSEEQIALYGDCYQAYTALKTGFDQATETLSSLYVGAPWREKKDDRGTWTEANVASDRDISAKEETIQQNILDLKAASRNATTRLADAIGFNRLSWSSGTPWYEDPDINEVVVDFG